MLLYSLRNESTEHGKSLPFPMAHKPWALPDLQAAGMLRFFPLQDEQHTCTMQVQDTSISGDLSRKPLLQDVS